MINTVVTLFYSPLRIGGRNRIKSDMSRMIFCVFGILTLFVPFHRYLGGYLNFDQHFNSLEQFENFDQHFGRTLKGFVDGMTEAADVAATDMADRTGYAFFNFLGKTDLNFTRDH